MRALHKHIKIFILFILFILLFSCKKDRIEINYPPINVISDNFIVPIKVNSIPSSVSKINFSDVGLILYFDTIRTNEIGFYVSNQNLYPISIYYEDSSLNLKPEIKTPIVLALDENSDFFITKYLIIDTNADYKIKMPHFDDFYGSINATHDDSYVYGLPYPENKTYQVGQGYNGEFTHNGDGRYAIDFLMPIGSEIVAARDGVVAQIVDKYSGHGIEPAYLDSTNGIVIVHNDGSYADYGHIKQYGSLVSKGQSVKKGQLIGYSGDVGYSNIAHLHFEVDIPYSLHPVYKKKSIPTKFDTKEGNNLYLDNDRVYTSINK